VTIHLRPPAKRGVTTYPVGPYKRSYSQILGSLILYYYFVTRDDGRRPWSEWFQRLRGWSSFVYQAQLSSFFVVKGPAADATNAPQPYGFFATPVMKMSSFFYQVLQLMEHQWNKINRGKPTTRRKTCPSATLSSTNLTWTDPGSNPGLRGERPVTNRLSHGTALAVFLAWGLGPILSPKRTAWLICYYY
jgi:hypothetical protein